MGKSDSEKLDAILMAVSNLYGSEDFPGMEGDIPEIKNHLNKINGVLLNHQVQLTKHSERWRWLKWAIPAGGAGGITGIGALLKQLFGG